MMPIQYYFSKKFFFNLKIRFLHQYWHKSTLYRFILFRKIIKSVNVNIDKNGADSQPAVLTALSNAIGYAFYSRVEGDIVEFGIQTGRTAVTIASNVVNYNGQFKHTEGAKRIFYFDSFEGLPQPSLLGDIDSPFVQMGIWGRGGCKGLTPFEFNNFICKIINKKFFEVKVGWFKETLPTLSSTQKFSVVHIDCDLYESAIDVLSFLFKKTIISNGAMILFDDWNLNHSNLNYGERRA